MSRMRQRTPSSVSARFPYPSAWVLLAHDTVHRLSCHERPWPYEMCLEAEIQYEHFLLRPEVALHAPRLYNIQDRVRCEDCAHFEECYLQIGKLNPLVSLIFRSQADLVNAVSQKSWQRTGPYGRRSDLGSR